MITSKIRQEMRWLSTQKLEKQVGLQKHWLSLYGMANTQHTYFDYDSFDITNILNVLYSGDWGIARLTTTPIDKIRIKLYQILH